MDEGIEMPIIDVLPCCCKLNQNCAILHNIPFYVQFSRMSAIYLVKYCRFFRKRQSDYFKKKNCVIDEIHIWHSRTLEVKKIPEG